MKFCTKCGYQMADDMMFCQKCGTKVESTLQMMQEMSKQANQQYPSQHTQQYAKQSTVDSVKPKPRYFLKSISIFCLFGAAVMLLFGITTEPAAIIGGLVYGILGIMFLLLSKTPKGSTYLFGKEKGIKIVHFVLICISLVFASVVIFSVTQCQHQYVLTDIKAATCTEDGKETYICELCQHKKYKTLKANGHTMENYKCSICDYVETKQDSNSSQNPNAKTTLSDIKKWYNNQTSAVSQCLMEYANSVNGLSSLNVNSSKFRFGEDSGWYDCHYTFHFTCKINGVTHTGEARAFMKYQDSTVNWFHFEIFSNNSIQSIVEHYDDSYDKIIENYYKELQKKYN